MEVLKPSPLLERVVHAALEGASRAVDVLRDEGFSVRVYWKDHGMEMLADALLYEAGNKDAVIVVSRSETRGLESCLRTVSGAELVIGGYRVLIVRVEYRDSTIVILGYSLA